MGLRFGNHFGFAGLAVLGFRVRFAGFLDELFSESSPLGVRFLDRFGKLSSVAYVVVLGLAQATGFVGLFLKLLVVGFFEFLGKRGQVALLVVDLLLLQSVSQVGRLSCRLLPVEGLRFF
ncbi:MAG TPA: hypothetical protein VET69_12450 [Terriglobales bacterium]|nr:hypothetical protein [Terriglobales bacterium]